MLQAHNLVDQGAEVLTATAAAAPLNNLPGGLVLQHEAELHQLITVGLVGEELAVNVILPIRVQSQQGQSAIGAVDLAYFPSATVLSSSSSFRFCL